MASEAVPDDEAGARRFRAALLLVTALGLGIRLWAAAALLLAACRFALDLLEPAPSDAARESAPEFLLRGLTVTAALLLPVPASGAGVGAVLLGLFVVLVLTLAVPRAIDDDIARARRRAPAVMLAVVLLLGMAGGLFGKYPFGGMMRHQMLLFLFGSLAAWVALDTWLRSARRAPWRVAGLALAAASLAVSGSATAHEIGRARHVSWPGVESLASAKAGTPFQVQTDGSSALSIVGAGFRPESVVVLTGRRLPTSFGNSRWISAIVPRDLFAKPGRLELRVVDPEHGASAPVHFEVLP